jgi:GNAT superfamily N-acetyltransferase
VEDFLHVDRFDRYLARVAGAPAGGASLLIHERLAMLGGSATLPGYRLLGVQTALIAARLAEARERGAELAVVTTAPGSRSEANMIKRGFSVTYARAILVRE